MTTSFSKDVLEWLIAAKVDITDQSQVKGDTIKPGQAFITGQEALIGLMGCGARLCQHFSKPQVCWLEGSEGIGLNIYVRSGLLLKMFDDGMLRFQGMESNKKVHIFSKIGERAADRFLNTEETKEKKKVEAKKEEVKPIANAHILDHAIGPYAEGYMLQVVFDDLVSLLNVAKSMGIEKPNLETVQPMSRNDSTAKTGRATEFLIPVGSLSGDPITVSLMDRTKPKKEGVLTYCNSCGDMIPKQGRKSRDGLKFCHKSKCRSEYGKLRYNDMKARAITR